MNKYEFLTKRLTLQAWEKQAEIVRNEAVIVLRSLEEIEKKIKELKEDTEK